jgi:hypothetical protein
MEVAGANRRWRGQPAPKAFGVPDGHRGSRRELAVAQLFSLIWRLRAFVVNTYIVIPARKIDGQSGWITDLVAGIVRRVLPAANPDFEHIYERVVAFHVELDSGGSPEREVGLDSSGRVVFIAPWRENLGVILDSYSEPFDSSKFEQIPAEQFEQEWKSYDLRPVA